MTPLRFLSLLLLPALALAACRPSYSPDDYATAAVQQMNRVEQAVIIGRRQVTVTADGNTGAATGGAAGGIVGSQAPGGNMAGAIGAVGGALVGGLFGAATERVAGNTTAVEYIVRKTNGELVSVTQRDEVALAIGERVLVIAGAQARIVPDYTQPVPEEGSRTATPATLPLSVPQAAAAPPEPAAALPAAETPAQPLAPPIGTPAPTEAAPAAEPLPALPAATP
jgi:outer membrane lipoprotein SlyB